MDLDKSLDANNAEEEKTKDPIGNEFPMQMSPQKKFAIPKLSFDSLKGPEEFKSHNHRR